LGPHAPRLTSKEIDLLHGIWLELSNEVAPEELHHHDVVHVALEELQKNILNGRREEIIGALRQHLIEIRDRRKSSSQFSVMKPGGANLPIGVAPEAIQENGVPGKT
jgi:hypothetical protein